MNKRLSKDVPKEMGAFADSLKRLESELGFNFESLNPQVLKNYQSITKMVTPYVAGQFVTKLDTIGKL